MYIEMNTFKKHWEHIQKGGINGYKCTSVMRQLNHMIYRYENPQGEVKFCVDDDTRRTFSTLEEAIESVNGKEWGKLKR
jgi:hypothetical protein